MTVPFSPFDTKKFVLLGLGLGLLISSAFLTFSYASKQRQSPQSTTQQEPETAVLDLSAPPENVKTLGILLLGFGGAGHQGGFLTDVIQVVHIDFDKKVVGVISVPRDLWVTLPSGQAAKVNTAFTLGEDPNRPVESGGQVAKTMMSKVTGLPIQHFIAIDFVAFKRLIGYGLDGIEVEVSETLDDPWYPITGKELETCGKTPEEVAQLSATLSGFELEKQFECRYEHLSFKPGIVKMEGEEALKFVRSRHGSGSGDFSRSQRQHAVLKAIRNKLISLDVLTDIPKYYKDLSQHTTSDLTLETAQYLAPALNLAQGFSVKPIVLSTDNVLTTSRSKNGQFILTPKAGPETWSEVSIYIQSQLVE